MTKIAVVGSRTWPDCDAIEKWVLSLPLHVVIVSGGAIGPDTVAEMTATKKGIRCIVHLPDWPQYGKKAGMLRNTKIIVDADIVVAFWHNKSRGTLDSINKAKSLGKPVYVFEPGQTIIVPLPPINTVN